MVVEKDQGRKSKKPEDHGNKEESDLTKKKEHWISARRNTMPDRVVSRKGPR